MANTKSAKAKVREIQNKTEFNKSIKNRYLVQFMPHKIHL